MRFQRWIVRAVAGVTTGLLLMVTPAIAHHSSTPFYDRDKPVEVEGVVTKFVFRNPHAALFIDVTDANGVTNEWQVELGAPVSLRRNGWTPDTLPIGTIIRVGGPSSRVEGSRGILGRRLTKPDGSPIVIGGRVEDSTPIR